MALHRIASITLGVPKLAETAAYYEQFGLSPIGDNRFSTLDGGHQLTLVSSPRRQFKELHLAADDEDDIGRIARQLAKFEIAHTIKDGALLTRDPGMNLVVTVSLHPRLVLAPKPARTYNRPGASTRFNHRSEAFIMEDPNRPVKPRRLGHLVAASRQYDRSKHFFLECLGFKESDTIKNMGIFMRIGNEHHNVALLETPVSFLHHTGWEVEDADEVGRGAKAMLLNKPERHAWGPGRHYVGSNYYWYLTDPAGNFSEYYADMDVITDDNEWKPGLFPAGLGWGLPPIPAFVTPDDLAEMMAAS